MSGVVTSAIAKRVSGDRPSAVQAALAAAIAGIAAAAVAYRVMRSS
jgi:hypothetical protein